MKIVLFEKRTEKGGIGSEAVAKVFVTESEVRALHKPVALKLFAIFNLLVAAFYAVLGTGGIIAIMFYDSAIGQRVDFADMIQLLQRSLWHSIGAGAALIVDHIMAGLAEIARQRRARSKTGAAQADQDK